MTTTASFRTRLASTDPAALRDAGRLPRSAPVAARGRADRGDRPGVRLQALPLRACRTSSASSSSSSATRRAGRTRSSTRASRRALVDADTVGRSRRRGAARVIAALGDEAERLDGVFTFWEDAVPATARVAAALGLPGMSPAAADGARSKLRTLRGEPRRRPPHAPLHAPQRRSAACRAAAGARRVPGRDQAGVRRRGARRPSGRRLREPRGGIRARRRDDHPGAERDLPAGHRPPARGVPRRPRVRRRHGALGRRVRRSRRCPRTGRPRSPTSSRPACTRRRRTRPSGSRR